MGAWDPEARELQAMLPSGHPCGHLGPAVFQSSWFSTPAKGSEELLLLGGRVSIVWEKLATLNEEHGSEAPAHLPREAHRVHSESLCSTQLPLPTSTVEWTCHPGWKLGDWA